MRRYSPRSGRPRESQIPRTRTQRASLVVSKVDRLTRSVAFLSRLLEAGVDVRLADLAAFRKRVEMLCHVLDDRGDHEAAAMIGAFGRALLDPAFKRPSN